MIEIKNFIKKNSVMLISIVAVIIIAIIMTVSITVIAGKNNVVNISADNVITISGDRELGFDLASVSDAVSLPVSGIMSDVEESFIEGSSESEEEVYELDYSELAIADVTNYVNVRSRPDETSEIVGYIYNGAVANIEEKAGYNGEWFKINSGNVNGYIKAEFFISGDDAADVIDKYITNYATVTCDRLNVRKEASVNSSRIGYIEGGEKVKVLENQGDWLVVEYLEDKKGYVSAEFVSISEEFTYARTLEEDKAIKAAEAALVARETDNSDKTKEDFTKYIDTSVTPADSYGSNAELRKAICDYACQFVGLPYVYGGNSLATGTDCSGFTMLIYKHFGYNLSRIPQGQLDGVGRKISYEEIQPGDIVLYSSKGVKATHAALYIGNGKVVHETNHRYGVLITSIDWIGPVWGIKNVID